MISSSNYHSNCKNKFFVQIVSDQVSHETTKYIHITYHTVCDKVNIGLLKLVLVLSFMKLVDIFVIVEFVWMLNMKT